VHREQEVGCAPGHDPLVGAARLGAQGPAGHQRVHVQVAAQVLGPGMQHQRKGAGATQPAGIGGKLAQGLGGALHQRFVDPARMRRGQAIEFMGQREHQVAIRHIQQLGQPGGAPGIACAGLTLRAVPVAAGVPAPLLRATTIAAQQLAAQRRGAAADDGAPGPCLGRAQDARTQILGPEVPQHFGQRSGHDVLHCRCGSAVSSASGKRRAPSGASGLARCR
jgi:hypothetical protein